MEAAAILISAIPITAGSPLRRQDITLSIRDRS